MNKKTARKSVTEDEGKEKEVLEQRYMLRGGRVERWWEGQVVSVSVQTNSVLAWGGVR